MNSRPAIASDSPAIAAIYSAGILERVATFQTEPRTPDDILRWFQSALPKIVIEEDDRVVAFAAAFPYSDRCCYAGVGEFSVYVAPDFRHRGAGRLAMDALIEASAAFGLHKLVSRVFPENEASLGLLKSVGFREVGVHEKHGRLDGVWRDVVVVERLIPENL